MSTPWLLAIPASRGLGRGFAGHLLASTRAPVVATARTDLAGTKQSILDSLDAHGVKDAKEREDAGKRLEVLEVDVTNEDSITSAAEQCKSRFPSKSHHLHLAAFAPGVLFPEKSPSAIDGQDALTAMKINLLGPMLLAKHFLPFLPRRGTKFLAADDEAMIGLPHSAIMALLSARVGSISDNQRGGWYSYRCTKSGVTQLAKTLDHHLFAQSGDKAMSVALHPGTVKTDLSKAFWNSEGDKANKGRGLFSPEQAAQQLIDVLRGLKAEHGHGRGGFWDWQGEAVLP